MSIHRLVHAAPSGQSAPKLPGQSSAERRWCWRGSTASGGIAGRSFLLRTGSCLLLVSLAARGLGRRGRRGRIARAAATTQTWHAAHSEALDLDAAVREIVLSWQGSMRSSLVAGAEVPRPSYALVFAPSRWAGSLSALLEKLARELRWPIKFAPILATVSDGPMLVLHTFFTAGLASSGKQPPRVFFLGKEELDEVSKLSVNPELRTTNTMKINGTVLAIHAFLEREPQAVGSLLLFGDISCGARLLNRALAALDVAYPQATKAGLVVSRHDNAAPFAIAFRGKVVSKEGGILGLALPAEMNSAIGFCGCRPLGRPLEVHEASIDVGGFIRTVGTAAWASGSRGIPGVVESKESSAPPRHESIPAATALRSIVKDAGASYEEGDIWIGVPRVSKLDERSYKVAPGAGEWALYQWAATTAEGTAVLEGEGPAGDGLGKKGIRCIQAFVPEPDFGKVGLLEQSYALERTARGQGAPCATLLFLGGSGASASVPDQSVHGGCAVGVAVIGHAGLTLGQAGVGGTGSFSYSTAKLRPTLMHRQSAGLVFLNT